MEGVATREHVESVGFEMEIMPTPEITAQNEHSVPTGRGAALRGHCYKPWVPTELNRYVFIVICDCPVGTCRDMNVCSRTLPL